MERTYQGDFSEETRQKYLKFGVRLDVIDYVLSSKENTHTKYLNLHKRTERLNIFFKN